MKCDVVKELIEEAAIEGKKPGKALALHMKSCPECLEEYKLMKEISEAVKVDVNIDLPADFPDSLFEDRHGDLL